MKLFSRFGKGLLPTLVLALYTPANAHAVIINTSVGDYEVSTLLTDFLSAEAILTSQVWWEDVTLAEEFAALTSTAFGTPNFGIYAPFFWYTTTDSVGPCAGIGERYAGVFWNDRQGRVSPVCAANAPNGPYTFAIAERVVTAVPEPSALALVGLGTFGLGLASRRRVVLRKARQ